MSKHLLPIPDFKNEDEEFEFWSTHDTTDYVDWSKSDDVAFPNLRLTSNVDLKLKQALLMHEVENLAKKKHTSKEELILRFLSDGIKREAAGLGS